MTESVHILRVVIASPSDVSSERAVAASVLEELNRSICLDRGLRFEAVRWETDTYPGFHADGPQGLIDSILQVEDSDLLIGIFWKRFGTPTKDGASGTEHEFRTAWEAWRRNGRPNLMVYFNQRAFSPQSREETDQWGQVLDFRKGFPKEGLWWHYKGTAEFERLLRNHLTNFIRGRAAAKPAAGSTSLALGSSTDSSSAYFEVQRSIIEEETRTFVGRENVQHCLDHFIAQRRKGYLIISGAPGQGKTALACNLVRRNNCLHHLVSRTGGRADTRLILRSLLAQLQTHMKLPISLPESVPELSKAWEEMLRCAVSPGPLLITIDGLDEVSDWEGGNLPYLPTDSLPDRVYVVVTTRPGDALQRLKGIVANVPNTIYDLERLNAIEIRQMLHHLCPGLDEQEMTRIADFSEGVPLYIRAVAGELKNKTQDLDLQTLPPSVEDFFRHATATVRELGHVELKEILALLATCRTSLTLQQLSEITNIGERELYDFGITKIRQFLREVDGRYSFYHTSFHEYVTRDLLYDDELRKGHSMIARWLQNSHGSDYALASLAYHLFESGDEAGLQEAIGQKFLAEKASHLGYAVLEDLDLLTKSFLKTGDPHSVERCVHMLELLGDMVGEKILREATHTLQPNRLSARTSWLSPSRVEPLFPRRNLFVGAIPATDVTADFFEIANRDGCIGIAVGDAPSTGLRSAFVARFLANLFQKLQDHRQAPALGQLLSRINSIIVPHPEFERVSMQCVELDCRRGLIYMANAGHPDLVLYSKRRRACDVLRVPGDLLHDPHRKTGRFRHYEQYVAEISPGDILVMVSDGLTEAHRLDGDPYGYRFMKVIEENATRPVKEIGDAILLDWRAQERNQAEVDDVTLVLFRVPGESPS